MEVTIKQEQELEKGEATFKGFYKISRELFKGLAEKLHPINYKGHKKEELHHWKKKVLNS